MARYVRVDKRKPRTYYCLVETRREGDKVVQKRLKYLGTSEPPPEYNWVLRHIDDDVISEDLYLVWHKGNDRRKGWHTENIHPFYITHKPYRRVYRIVWRRLAKPRRVDWSSFDWVKLRRNLINTMRINNIFADEMWFAKARHWASAIAKVKRGEGVGLDPLLVMATFEQSVR